MSKARAATDQIVKLIVGAGQASPSPPVGPALGSKGVKSMDFCKVSTTDYFATKSHDTHHLSNAPNLYWWACRNSMQELHTSTRVSQSQHESLSVQIARFISSFALQLPPTFSSLPLASRPIRTRLRVLWTLVVRALEKSAWNMSTKSPRSSNRKWDWVDWAWKVFARVLSHRRSQLVLLWFLELSNCRWKEAKGFTFWLGVPNGCTTWGFVYDMEKRINMSQYKRHTG